MATLSFSVQYDMSTPTSWSVGTPTTHDASSLVLESGTQVTRYLSGDSSFHYQSPSTLPNDGTVSEITQYLSGIEQFSYGTGHFSISKIIDYLKKTDALLDLEAYLLAGDDRIIGSSGNDKLLGFKGNDSIEGGAGADNLDGGLGINTVSYAGSSTAVSVTLNGKLSATVSGGDADGDTVVNFQSVTGSAHDDSLTGDSGNNLLDGGAGNDTMTGLDGNDTYIVDSLGDTIVEGNGKKAGIDTVIAKIDYSLGLNSNLENLSLFSGSGNINASGNELNNVITGNDGDNRLDGAAGVDTLIGGLGDDTYIVDLLKTGSSAKLVDKIVEKAGQGNDTLRLTPTLDLGLRKAITLKLGNYLDNLDAQDTGANWLNLTGNGLDNILTGNDAANILDGGKGADELHGGAGADIYLVDNLGDTVHEVASADIDLVKIKIAVADGSFSLGEFVENAELISSVAFKVIGNGLDNKITGNSKSNTIEGGGGADNLDGGAGSDSVSYATSSAGVNVTLNGKLQATVSGGDADGDSVFNFENIIGSAHADTLIGDSGANILDGGEGADQLTGGDGNDTYLVDDPGDVIVEGNGKKAGKDTIIASIDYVLGNNSNLENLTLSGSGHINATGNELDNTIIGNDGDNILDGGSGGKDTLKGGKGNDTYILELIKSGSNAVYRDTFVEKAGEGSDSLILHSVADLGLSAAVTLTLADNIEILDASDTGINRLNLTGNIGDNTLVGNAADNVLDGRGGKDILKGGAGNDTYKVDSIDDEIVETGVSDIDAVEINIAESGGSFTLAAELENAVILSKVDFDLIGNAADNQLTGNAKNNLIWGGDGNDDMDGGDGTDTLSYTDSLSGVTIVLKGKTLSTGIGGAADGDTFKNFENIIGSDFADTLTGDAGDNVLDGGLGIDVMTGGKGNDTYVVDNSSDDVIEETNGGVDLVEASISYDLSLHTNLENLTLTGSSNINGIGNDLDNIVIGNDGINVLNGGKGNDTLKGGAGNDTLEGGDGDDILDGGGGTDSLTGGKGNDSYSVDLVESGSIIGLGDAVTELAGEGIDTLILYNDRNISGTANIILLENSNSAPGPSETNKIKYLENIDASNTTLNLNLQGNAEANLLIGNASSNTLKGGGGNDTLKGGDGADILEGGVGIDTLNGGNDNDTLNGGADNDTLTGGDGNDLLTGGLGLDTFVFDVSPSKQNQDHIVDFNLGEGDRINLKQSLFSGAGKTGKLSATEFSSSNTPSTASIQHLLYDKDSGELWYNSDGSGSAALVLIATLDNHIDLTYNNIYLV